MLAKYLKSRNDNKRQLKDLELKIIEKQTRRVPKTRSSLDYQDHFDDIIDSADEYKNDKDLNSDLDNIDNIKPKIAMLKSQDKSSDKVSTETQNEQMEIDSLLDKLKKNGVSNQISDQQLDDMIGSLKTNDDDNNQTESKDITKKQKNKIVKVCKQTKKTKK